MRFNLPLLSMTSRVHIVIEATGIDRMEMLKSGHHDTALMRSLGMVGLFSDAAVIWSLMFQCASTHPWS